MQIELFPLSAQCFQETIILWDATILRSCQEIVATLRIIHIRVEIALFAVTITIVVAAACCLFEWTCRNKMLS